MVRNGRAWLLVGLLGVLAVSCTRLDRARPVPQVAEFQFEPREGSGEIPLSYGDLVAVTPVDGRLPEVVMWFEQGQDRIIGVRLHVGRGVAAEKVLVIPRR